MSDEYEEARIDELDYLRAPVREVRARWATRERILSRAASLLAARREPVTGWDVLVEWARPGLAAAAILLAVFAGALRAAGADDTPQVAAEEMLRNGANEEGIPSWLVASVEPDEATILEAALLAPNPNGGER